MIKLDYERQFIYMRNNEINTAGVKTVTQLQSRKKSKAIHMASFNAQIAVAKTTLRHNEDQKLRFTRRYTKMTKASKPSKPTFLFRDSATLL